MWRHLSIIQSILNKMKRSHFVRAAGTCAGNGCKNNPVSWRVKTQSDTHPLHIWASADSGKKVDCLQHSASNSLASICFRFLFCSTICEAGFHSLVLLESHFIRFLFLYSSKCYKLVAFLPIDFNSSNASDQSSKVIALHLNN